MEILAVVVVGVAVVYIAYRLTKPEKNNSKNKGGGKSQDTNPDKIDRV